MSNAHLQHNSIAAATTSSSRGWMAPLMLLGLTLAATGCMATPEDGEYIGPYYTAVDFSGMSGYAGEPIAIQAWDVEQGDWETLSFVLTDNVAMPGSDGEVFEWAKSVVVPLDLWTQTGSSYQAYVRAIVYETGEVCYASSGEPYATIWASGPAGIKEEIGDLTR